MPNFYIFAKRKNKTHKKMKKHYPIALGIEKLTIYNSLRGHTDLHKLLDTIQHKKNLYF